MTTQIQNQQNLIAKLESIGAVYTSNARHIELGMKRNSYTTCNGLNQIQVQTTGDVPVQEVDGAEVKNVNGRVFYNFN